MNTPISSRRQFLGSALAAGATLPFSRSLMAQQPKAKWTRRNINDPASQLDSYRAAVTAMLKLPPSHPHNWYRNAFIHILDCPHHNWWLLPWHRGFIGWFERTCRVVSNNPNFALPYWDWTTQPSMPEQFYNSVLDPTSELFYSTKDKFIAAFEKEIPALWESFTKPQRDALAQRTQTLNDGTSVAMDSAKNIWAVIVDNYPDQPARALNSGKALPTTVGMAGFYVQPDQVMLALQPTVFQDSAAQVGFGSDISAQHSEGATGDFHGAALLEHGPHDQVHNDIGFDGTNYNSFMPSLLSPVDPIFFMHHSNIDRLWDVWTRKQQAANLPTLPTKSENEWLAEPFLFYVDEEGKTLSKTCADSSVIGTFDYDYAPGFGEDIVKQSVHPLLAGLGGLHAASLESAPVGIAAAKGSLMLPGKMLSIVTKAKTPPPIVARVTFAPGVASRGTTFQLRANSDQPDDKPLAADDPSLLAVIRPFAGSHDGRMSFTVPIAASLMKLHKAGKLSLDKPLDLRVTGMRNGKPINATVEGIFVTTVR